MTPFEVKQALKQEAERLGLIALGFTDASPLCEVAEALTVRRERGWEADFEPKPLAPRSDPRLVMPQAETVLVGAIPYYQAMPSTMAGATETAWHGSPRGFLSRYVWGQDYHKVLKERLWQLADLLKRWLPSAAVQVHVDTGLLVERALAQRAGVGWLGNNCLIIHPVWGSWIFLGLILTSAKLPPDAPLTLDCGECDLCLAACPTGAFPAPGQLDPNRCLAYATQMRGALPEPLRKPLALRVWGCDTCQDVCPHNRGVIASPVAEFAPFSAVQPRPFLLDLVAMGKGAFRRQFGPTAAAWRGKRTLQRNALVALGNWLAARGRREGGLRPELQEAICQVLANALAAGHPDLRAHAAWALGRWGTAWARDQLARALEDESDDSVRAALVTALERVSAATPTGRPGGSGNQKH